MSRARGNPGPSPGWLELRMSSLKRCSIFTDSGRRDVGGLSPSAAVGQAGVPRRAAARSAGEASRAAGSEM